MTDQFPAETLVRRLGPGQMQGLLNKTLLIEEGQSALLLIGGRLDITLGPGKHSMGNILSSRTRDTTVALLRTADIPLEVSVARLLTSDPLPLSLDFRLVVKIDEPMRFVNNLASSVEAYTTQSLAAAIYPPVRSGCEEFIGSRSVRQLGAGQNTGADLSMALAANLDQQLSRWGLRIISPQAVNIQCEAWDEVTQSRTNYFIAASDGHAELEGRKRLFDVMQDSQIQTLAEETLEVVGVEQRLSLWERMRNAVVAKSQGEVRSQTELEDLARDADSDRVLKDDEHQVLVRTLAEGQDDHEKSRAFLLRRVEAEREFDLQKLDLGHRFGLSRERFSLEVANARQDMEDRWELELRRVDLEIEGQRREVQFRRDQEAEDQELRNRGQIGQARTDATVAEIERDQDAKDLGMLVDIYGQYKDVKRRDKWEGIRAELDAEQRRRDIALAAREREVEIGIRESRERHNLELERINTLSGAGIETLIAVSGPEQSQLLAQLARTRALSTCSPEQILAMQAESSPQVADALREILTATAATGQLEQFERLVSEIKGNAQASREDYQHNLGMMGEMFNKALDSVKETAVAFSPVGARQPNRPQPATGPDGVVSLLFSDIESSTAMTERLGDEAAQVVLRAHNSILRLELERFQGFEVKSMGDGFMLSFATTGQALGCAVAVQRALVTYNNENSEEPLRVRMGLHTGKAIQECWQPAKVGHFC